jgi:Xaa-Pro dipeptidase
LLEKYYPVGGVRIEDDILITADGNENLTTAPKGEEALRIINEGIWGEGKDKGKEKSGQKKRWLF